LGGIILEIQIIYEDNHLLVVEKPVNILSQQDNTGDPDILSILKNDIKIRYNKPGNVYLGLVHRLDRPVGGVMVFAKTSKAASRLSEQIRKKEFKKTYLAVINGVPDKIKGRLEDYLVKDTSTNIVSVVGEDVGSAKKAILDYKVIGSKNELSLVKINLLTGRPHQIRVQFAHLGHSLYGDQKYGNEASQTRKQIALWSHIIECKHPTEKSKMEFKSFPPKEKPWSLFQGIEI
jgi:23S rRNA pseudouridine1911/1915/1917 synthase